MTGLVLYQILNS